MNKEEARKVAKHYVARLLGGAFTQGPYMGEQAAKECCLGSAGDGDGGYELRRGKITVPYLGAQRWVFSFAELEEENEQEPDAGYEDRTEYLPGFAPAVKLR